MLDNQDQSLLEILNIGGENNVEIESTEVKDSTKYITIRRTYSPQYCPVCGSRMESRGLYTRKVNHPIFQDRYSCILLVKVRKWICRHCGHYMTDCFTIIEKYRQSTSLTTSLVLNDMKDLNRTTTSIAQQFNLSDTQVHNIFTMYVDMKRLALPEIISVDEVYLNIKPDSIYAFVIMDFVSEQMVDIVHNRWSSTLDDYFGSIPLSERLGVKAVISDAYGPYLALCEKHFPNAVQILDSFHCVKYLNDLLNRYVNSVMKKYREKQKKALEEKNLYTNRENSSIRDSEEIILLRDYRWVLLKNRDDISYSQSAHYHRKLGKTLYTSQIERMFFRLDTNLETMRDLKELYISFNHETFESEQKCRERLLEIISAYQNSGLGIFEDFASFLIRFSDSIIRSFTMVEVVRKKDQETYYSRLSNGPMESFNRKPKDYKRNSRGSTNYDYTRNRILWSNRINPAVLAVPKTMKQGRSYRLNRNTLEKRRRKEGK